MGPIPFEHCEFGRMKRAAFFGPKNPRKVENARFPARNQLFHGKFGRSMEISGRNCPVRLARPDRHGMEMGFVAGRDLDLAAFDFDKSVRLEIGAKGGFDSPACPEGRSPVGKAVRSPPSGLLAHACFVHGAAVIFGERPDFTFSRPALADFRQV